MIKKITPGDTIGILGGGQLGRMMALSAKAMGYKIAVLEPGENSPCGQIADVVIRASYDDLEAAKELAKVSDVITYEFENIDHGVLTWLEENAYLPQGHELIWITQDRENEKSAIRKSGGKVAPYRIVATREELIEALREIGFPSVLKTCRGGYDGKGQAVIRKEQDMEEAANLLKHGRCILEKWVSFEKELSVIVTRSTLGEIVAFPVCENLHVDNILFRTIVPARVSNDISKEATKTAIALAESLGMIGTLAVEMFLTTEGQIYINELAPRPHNSGHFSMDACETSQFEQHIRAVCGWPLGKTTLLKPVIMMNILGDEFYDVLDRISQFKDSKLHLYGKKEVKTKRKMGHLNVLANSIEEAEYRVKELAIWQEN